MKKFVWRATMLVLVLLAACSINNVNLPDPEGLFLEIIDSVELPEMIDVSEEFLEPVMGINSCDYEAAVYYILSESTGPDEIAIIKAKDDKSATDIQEKLENRLEYKEKSAQIYLTENMPIIQDGIVRRDDLTVSLIVSEKASEILEIYDSYG